MPRAYAWRVVYRPSLESPEVFEEDVYTTELDPTLVYETIFSEYPNAVIEEVEFWSEEEIPREIYEEIF